MSEVDTAQARAPMHLNPGELLATVDGVRFEALREFVVVAIDEEADGSANFVLRCAIILAGSRLYLVRFEQALGDYIKANG